MLYGDLNCLFHEGNNYPLTSPLTPPLSSPSHTPSHITLPPPLISSLTPPHITPHFLTPLTSPSLPSHDTNEFSGGTYAHTVLHPNPTQAHTYGPPHSNATEVGTCGPPHSNPMECKVVFHKDSGLLIFFKGCWALSVLSKSNDYAVKYHLKYNIPFVTWKWLL